MKKAIALLFILILIAGCAQKLVPNTEKSDSTQYESQKESGMEGKQERLETITQTMEKGSKIFETTSAADLEDPAVTTKNVLITARQFAYDPELVEVNKGDKVMLTITSVDVGHGFALPDFGINTRIPAEESVTVVFVADKRGEFQYFNSVYSGSGWKDMTGTFVVK